MTTKWKNIPLSHKIVTAISILSSLAVIVLAVLQLCGIWQTAGKIYVPLMGVTMLCQAYNLWNTSRKVAYFSIGTAIFIFLCAIAVFLIP
ncbi:MAG: hypothetical protein IJD59_04890 [Clostridia bacterium]|nr:hypothetical protein [Clostridia bacterium]